MRLYHTAATAIALAIVGLPAAAMADDHSVDHAALAEAIEADYDSYLAPLFVHFHRNPELSFLEKGDRGAHGAGTAAGRA